MTIARTLRTIHLVLATIIVVLTMSVPGHASAAGISASPNPSPAGSTVTITGSGFDSGEVVEINFAGDLVMTTADSNGNLQTPFTINPMVPAGTHPLEANGANGTYADSNLTVSTVAPVPTGPPAPVAGQGSVAASPDPSPAGSTVTVSGSGFLPGEMIEINFAGDTTTTTADSNGDYRTPFTINQSVPVGSHPLDANGMGGSWASNNLTVSAAASAPTPAPAPAPQPAPTPTVTPNQTNTPPPPPAATVPATAGTGPASDSDTTVSEPDPTKRQLESSEIGTSETTGGSVGNDETASGGSENAEERDEAVSDIKVIGGPTQNSSSDSGTGSGRLNLAAVLLILVAGLATSGAVYLALRPTDESTSPDQTQKPITLQGWVPPVGPRA